MILESAANEDFSYAEVDDLGIETKDDSYLQKHIDAVLNLTLVEKEQIAKKGFKVVVDGVNSTGGIFIPALLEQLGVEVVKLYCDPTGHFPHNPEPLEKHLGAIMEAVVTHKADFGIVVDPDVDRLAFISEEGSMFGEEYTLVACADYVLSKTPGSTVSNLSSSRALSDITNLHKGSYTAASVGEVNVVQCMKDTNAIIGGEGNGGIIYPESHYGRDALVGTALFLMLLSEKNIKVSELRASYPTYFMRKDKIELDASIDVDSLLAAVEKRYQHERINTQDGVKIDFENHWVHLRKSNTEPIIRVYTEAKSVAEAETVANAMMDEIKGLV
jgi:phosphomannomutase